MEIEVLVVPDCPNQQLAADRLRRALDDVGLPDTGFTTRVVIAGQADTERSAFTGSPTILINGRDPFAEPGTAPAVACRAYRTGHGLAGAPDLDQLRQALAQAAVRQDEHPPVHPRAGRGKLRDAEP
ncbi:hypothetical protein [Streptomyces virginiae]|uniref:hypothetical protein n=1 Tax=Streptomyces virginiae TaxID=1961 RepID=UPI0022581470|nr:hypothetical protein [Streptomyces virginiae]MCX5181026.1 hypothetical protein [Streptomyces virginiae]